MVDSHFKSDYFILAEYKETFLALFQFFKVVYYAVRYSRLHDLFNGLRIDPL